MLTDEEATELQQLHELAYGRASAQSLDTAALERIAELTAKRRQELGPITAKLEDPVLAVEVSAATYEPILGEPAGIRRRWRRRLAGVAVLAVMFGGGFAAGTYLVLAPSAREITEFSRPQTDEDVLNVLDTPIDADSTRFVARIQGFDIFLAKDRESKTVCVLTAGDGPALMSASCATDSETFGLVTEVTPTLTLAAGDTTGIPIAGEPVQLSENLTAYVVK
jgi:hypothetical protein